MNEHKELIISSSATAEQLRQRLELRRSSAAQKHRNRKKYHRPTEKRANHDER